MKRKTRGSEIVGKKINSWTVLSPAVGLRGKFLLCRCDCGRESVVDRYNLVNGRSKSCPACALERAQAARVTHGMSYSRAYRQWQSMKNVCHNPRAEKYGAYGGSGIYVFRKWRRSFESFIRDIGAPQSEKAVISRLDKQESFVPGNVFWENGEAEEEGYEGDNNSMRREDYCG